MDTFTAEGMPPTRISPILSARGYAAVGMADITEKHPSYAVKVALTEEGKTKALGVEAVKA